MISYHLFHFPGCFAGVIFTNQYDGDFYNTTKGEVCVETGVDIFVKILKIKQ